MAQRARVKPDPVQVVPAVLRFGDALASVGETTQARTQYDLAIRMSGQTGLRDSSPPPASGWLSSPLSYR